MQIICKSCNSIFNIPKAKIPINGAKVKCLKCKSQIITPPPKKLENDLNQQSVKDNNENSDYRKYKRCPYCKEKIVINAEKCKWCQSDLNKVFEEKVKINIAKAKGTIKSSTFYQRYWKKWNIGEKYICASIFIAISSLFLSWVDIGLLSQNGWQQQGYFFLLFFVYPAYILFKKKKANIYIGYIISILSAGLLVWYINTKTAEIYNSTVNVSGIGSWIFLASTLLLGYGFIKIEKKVMQTKNIVFFAKQIKKHKWIVLSIIFLLVISPKAYNTISIKLNKPYNLLMNLSVNSTKDDIQEANKNISKLNNTELITTASKHIEALEKKLDSINEDSEDLSGRKFAILVASANLAGRNLEILAPDMTYEELAEKYGTQKTSLPQISSSIRESCEKKWGNDYRMVKYCIENQTKAKNNISSYPYDNIRINCEKKWGDDYRMIEYCIKKQTEAKRSIYE